MTWERGWNVVDNKGTYVHNPGILLKISWLSDSAVSCMTIYKLRAPTTPYPFLGEEKRGNCFGCDQSVGTRHAIFARACEGPRYC